MCQVILFVSKFLKEIQIIVVVTFCVRTSIFNFFLICSYFLPISASLFLQSLWLKKCSQISLAVIAVHVFYYKQLKDNRLKQQTETYGSASNVLVDEY